MAAKQRIDSLTCGLYHSRSRASPRRPRRVLVPTRDKSPTIEDNLAFEWLLCLASTVEVSKRLRLTEVSEAPQNQEFPHTKNRKFVQAEGNQAINPSGKVK
jgi:hypothetical protein